jgi:hypothetical protein
MRNTIRKSGSVLIFVMVIVLVTMALGTGMLTLGTQSRMTANRQTQDISARSAADAGMELAVQQINNAVTAKTWQPTLKPAFVNVPIADTDSSFSVTTAYDAAEGYHIQSTGTCRNRLRTVESVLRLQGLFENAVLCKDTLSLKSGTVIQCIDSRISMNPADTNEKVVIGTNSTADDSVILNNNVIVNGDIVVGVGGDLNTVIKDQGATTGDRYALPQTVDFPTVNPPLLWGPDTPIEVKNGEKTIGVGGDYPATGRFSGINMKQGTRLIVAGSCVLYITGNVTMGQSSEIYLDPAKNSSLKIYLKGNWSSDNNSGINNGNRLPNTFTLYGTGAAGQKIDVKAKSDFYGTIYAPNADVTIFSGGDLYGAFTSKSFELKNPAKFYYDTALRDVNVYDDGVRFVVSRWNED